jgi:hypothetical protein
VAGVSGGRLRVRLHAPAHEGRANAELIGFVARLLRVSSADVRVTAGAGARHKLLRIRGVTIDEARRDLRL